MKNGVIVSRSMGELRRAAAEGQAYYSCERFKDAYGRLVVGIGARLEGRALRIVAKTGRKAVQVSPMALHDQGRYPASPVETEENRNGDPIPGGIDGLFQVVAKMHPRAARRLVQMNPDPCELAHGMAVGTYVRRLMAACNAIQREAPFRYSSRDRMTGFVAGLVHDIGRWNGQAERDHAARGAGLLRDLIPESGWIREISDMVTHHHAGLCQFSGARLLKIAPVALAEAVTESPSGPGRIVCDLVAAGVPETARDLFACLCNLECCAPPLAIVRLHDNAHPWKYDLAVSLRADPKDPFAPYLLRFARCDVRGRRKPVSLADRCLIGPQHPEYETSERAVIDLLPPAVYERVFKDYEGLIPVYQRVMGMKSSAPVI